MSSSTTSKAQERRPLGTVAAIVRYVGAVAIVVALVVANIYANRYSGLISVFFDQATQRIIPDDSTPSDYYKSDFTDEASRQAHLTKVATDIEREGITLLENNGALPLAAGARISVFGQDSVDPVYGGSGAGSISTSNVVTLGQGLADAGLQVNPTLWSFYETGPGAAYRKTTKDVYGQGEYTVNEVPRSTYTADVIASFADYADAAIVVIGRAGGETADLTFTPTDAGFGYLQIDNEERDMLALATEHFDTVIVMLNTDNTIELGVLDSYDIDAVVWIGAFGQTGATAVGEMLVGTVNPSGAVVDTYAYDVMSSPAMANFGSYQIANSEIMWGNTYLVYAEGVYVGYRYYETRYEDAVLGTTGVGSYDYAKTVQYPFGYGLSYTEFTWSGFAVSETDDTYEVKITVANTGDTAGKDIVQVYLQRPYTDYDKVNGIEKPAVELVGYTKTDLIAAGGSQNVTVSVPKEYLKVWDSYGYGSYIVEPGDYFLAVGDNAHDALNNILATKGFTTADGMDAAGDPAKAHQITRTSLDTETYAVSEATGETISNQFTSADMKTWDASFKYLSRSDWAGTWPKTYADGVWTAPADFVRALELSVPTDPAAEVPKYDTTDPELGTLTAAMLREIEWDDPLWDTLLDQASLDELEQLVRVGGYATLGVESISLPATVDKDGPAGISGTLVGGSSGMGYPPASVLAATWNDALAEEMGKAIGEDSIYLGVAGWYAPSMNIHRSPYSGRNFEYFSEDGVISGRMGAALVRGAQSKGVIPFVKHFAVNDQETNRMGGAMMANEQSLREIYLKPFELSVRDGGAIGMMAAMNRIGTLWVGAHAGLMTETLRDEWGFTGVVITDQASFSVFSYEDYRMGLAAGTDLWLNTDASLWQLDDADMTPTVQAGIRRAAHNVAYAVVHSNAMNGISAGARIEQITPLWRWALYGVDVLLGGAALALVGLTTSRLLRQGRKTDTADEPTDAVAE
ncbi:MAG: glycoside hydrolase family 3 C-terminal domain-containing protein [Propionibacteriaceae bacterium]|jgi:beta-glucosidase|nr:glycoside hydrolase family 3 C-terminal domain-containing protein [Propionibacteriaceae bacterium]